MNEHLKSNMSSRKDMKCMNKRTQILNDDCLTKIFSYLEIKDLFRLMRTSHQFFDCIHSALELRQHLMIGDCHECHYFICETTLPFNFYYTRDYFFKNDITS